MHLANKKPWIYSDLFTSDLYKNYYSINKYVKNKIRRIEFNKVSIILPVYNVEKYLKECLDSIISQTYKNIEILIINDGSTDRSLEIINEYKEKDERIRVFSQTNSGLSAARNVGLKNASGEFIFFVDSDDKLSTYTIEHLFNNIVKHQADVAICSFQYFSDCSIKKFEIDEKWPLVYEKASGKYSIINSVVEKEFCCVAWNKMYRLSIIKNNNMLFSENLTHEDIPWLWQYFSACSNYFYLNERLYYYRLRSDSITSRKDYLYYSSYLPCYSKILKTIELNKDEKSYILQKVSFSAKKALKSSPISKKIIVLFSFCLLVQSNYGSRTLVKRGFQFLTRRVKRLYNKLRPMESTGDLPNKLIIKEFNELRCKFDSIRKQTERDHLSYFMLQALMHLNVRKNSVLIIESQDCHGECLPTVVHCFLQLGFEVDVWLSEEEYKLKPLDSFSGVRTFQIQREILGTVLSLPLLHEYTALFWNTEYDYWSKNNVRDQYMSNCLPPPFVFYQCHRPEFSYLKLGKKAIKLSLAEMENYPAFLFNCCYFGDIFHKTLGLERRFIVVGNIERKRKDFDLLIKAVDYLSFFRPDLSFKIDVVARVGKLVIPDNLKKYFNFWGCLDYPSMYEKIRDSDFILPLFNSKIKEHSRYLENGVSGTINQSIGFGKPMIIEESFAKRFMISSEASIIYSEPEAFKEAFLQALEIKEADYQKLKLRITSIRDTRIAQNLTTMKLILETPLDNVEAD